MDFFSWLKENKIKLNKNPKHYKFSVKNKSGKVQTLEFPFVSFSEYYKIETMFWYLKENAEIENDVFYIDIEDEPKLKNFAKIFDSFSQPLEKIELLKNTTPLDFVEVLNKQRKFEHTIKTNKLLKESRVFLDDDGKTK